MENSSHGYWEGRWKQTSARSLEGRLREFNGKRDDILDLMKAHGVHRVCDAACGFGAYSLLLASNGFEVEGFDLAESAVAVTRELLADYQVDTARYRTASILDTGYADGYFDAVVAYSVLDHMTAAEGRRAMTELARIIRKNGLLVLALDSPEEDDLQAPHTLLPDGSLLYTQGNKAGMTVHFYTPAELPCLLKGWEQLCRKTGPQGEQVFVLKKLDDRTK